MSPAFLDELGGGSPERLILLAVYLGLGVLLFLLAGPMVRRRVKPNGFYGLRVPATFADESVWYDANEATGRDLRRAAAGCSLLGLVAFFAPVPDEAFGIGLSAAWIVALGVASIVGWRRANRMLRERRGG